MWAYVIREVKRNTGRKTGNKDDIEADYGFLTGVPDVSEINNQNFYKNFPTVSLTMWFPDDFNEIA